MLLSVCISSSAWGPVPSAGLPKSPTWAREARLEKGWRCNFKTLAHSGAMETWGTTPRETPGPLWSPSPAPSSCLTWGSEGEENVRIMGYEGRTGREKNRSRTILFAGDLYPSPPTERRPLAGRRGQAFRFPWLGGNGPLFPFIIPYPQPHLLPAPNWLKQNLKETQAALPHLEMAFPKSARKLIMKHTMLIRSCISQLGTRARAGPWGLAPTPCPSLPRPAPTPTPVPATPPPRQPPAVRSTRLRSPLAHGINSGSTCCFCPGPGEDEGGGGFQSQFPRRDPAQRETRGKRGGRCAGLEVEGNLAPSL